VGAAGIGGLQVSRARKFAKVAWCCRSVPRARKLARVIVLKEI
jgi:hypothetical protein